MGVYSNFLNEGTTTTYDSILEEATYDSLLESSIEEYFEESSIEAAMKAVTESTRNWNAIVEACSIEELCYLSESKTEMVYEGAKLDAFFTKAKEFFANVWAKIQSIFKKAIAQFDVWFKSDKDFIKKYSKQLNIAKAKKNFGDKEVQVYKYIFYSNVEHWSGQLLTAEKEDAIETLDDVKSLVHASDYADAVKKFTTEEQTKLVDSYRGVLLDKTEAIEAKDFSKSAKEYFQGGDSKESVSLATAIDSLNVVSFLESSDKIKKALNTALSNNKKAIDGTIKNLQNLQKEIMKGDTIKGTDSAAAGAEGAKHSLATKSISTWKSCKIVAIEWNGHAINALKGASRQAKSLCVKVITGKEEKAESAFVESGFSLLGDVQMQ